MNSARLAMLTIGTACLIGCSNEPSQSSLREADDASVPYYTARELKSVLAEQTHPVLVEFCVPTGCYRCEEMRPQINQLAKDESNGIEVVRVDLHLDRALANEMGVTACPSYIAFDGGEEVFRSAYPTSFNLIASELQGR